MLLPFAKAFVGKFRFPLLAILLLMVLPFSVKAQAEAGDCDGTPGDDVIECASNPTLPDANVEADLGRDYIFILPDVTAGSVLGDGRPGGHTTVTTDGDDLIFNEGITGSLLGDGYIGFIGTYGGDDTITNEGQTSWINGDNARNGGNDTIVNNGLVSGGILGDAVLENAGDDYIVNNGSVGLVNAEGENGGQDGDDTFINHGVITGSVEMEGGNDRVELHYQSNGGSDNLLVIDGGEGNDTLHLNFIRSDQANSSGTPSSGSLTINGQTFQWTNFENISLGAVAGDCDGTPNDDIIECFESPANPDGVIDADVGNDMIIIGYTVTLDTSVYGDGWSTPDKIE